MAEKRILEAEERRNSYKRVGRLKVQLIVKDDALKLWNRTIQRRQTALTGRLMMAVKSRERVPSRLRRQARPSRLSTTYTVA